MDLVHFPKELQIRTSSEDAFIQNSIHKEVLDSLIQPITCVFSLMTLLSDHVIRNMKDLVVAHSIGELEGVSSNVEIAITNLGVLALVKHTELPFPLTD
ncbi:hypothetical protein TVAGG3_0286720 [Trichomonas vaginalis G3]|uniref:hypothetical protein n=1 Tax=Trichomonas vaginalis (strain ATCC PRA-98 / G3) TaxID=412133 RepID=UPI0021E53CF8|nr:hypothetical protein TVAGG3_0286720 [Trichomonas vaginalis G3]KAI5526955.1 hypothetical protein TVAGG3_0286720 [Trichomonas vaginalis G3]